ncbi:hypothetical protein COEREDRAFT_85479 [Coemansia reversa NRRL 1564]|uniref:Uncharacterized protein n=1 Tax=Coemansia reversa (strain ATCC 12441 / NRRL 1564) TaxID=763665 RepID=A0A2G5BG76_COERN|nr:hypothetical protein COEREDRAFT_85479 [Coemansia reversa NRRL 1564]|eukprot:PIA18010.1 hypothetical protein COEREDRAFT_85479 [Coemansia reversa NRRL 1564]
MAKRDQANRTRTEAPRNARNLWWWGLRGGILYVLFVLLFTCPGSPDHPICQIGSLAQSKIIVPGQKLALSTEPGARISTAYNAHLVPFYQKHGAPVVSGVCTFVCGTVNPTIKQVTKPACEAIHRTIDPHTEKMAAAYTIHAKPAVDAIRGAVCSTANTAIIPVASVVSRHAAYAFNEYAVPCARSAAFDYVAPFYVNHIRPRWNDQIRPALYRYVKVGVKYTRTNVLPAIADGTTYGYEATREFASAHIIPYAKRGTLHVYVFFKQHVCPPVSRLYGQTLKPHVDRVVPWDKVELVTDKLSLVVSGVSEFVLGFGEELYYMCYTIFTGEEHPSVVQQLRDSAVQSVRKDSGFMDSLKIPIITEDSGKIHSAARRFSGSARQWIQIARGWVGSAAGSAKDNLASYGSRATATAFDMWNQATSVASEATELVDEQTTYIKPAASVIEGLATTASIATETAEEAWDKATESMAASVTKEAAEDWSQATAAAATGAETAAEYLQGAGSAVSAVVESVEEVTQPPIVSRVTESAAGITETAASYGSAVTEAVAKTLRDAATDAAESVVSLKDSVTETAADIVETAESFTSAAAEAVTKTLRDVTGVVVERAVSAESSVTEAAADQLGKIAENASDALETATDVAKRIVPSASDVMSAIESAVGTIGPDSLLVSDNVSDAAASVTSAIASVLEEIIDEGPSIPVPAAIPTKPSESADSGASIIAEDAASVIYEARDKMAGILIGDEEKEKFSELVKSASEGFDNLEKFPTILSDIGDNLVLETSEAEKVLESIVEQLTTHSVVSEVGEKAAQATSAVAEKLTANPVIPEFKKRADEKISAATAAGKIAVLNVASKASEKAKAATSAVGSVVESGISAAANLPPVKRATEEIPVATSPADYSAANEQPTEDTESLAETVNEDVRKSALNWVKDARSSISKELAEERTRQGSPAADATTSLSDMGERIAPPAGAASDSAVKEPAPEASAEQLLMDHTVPVLIKTDPVAPVAPPKKRDSDKNPTRTGSPITPKASKSVKAVPAAEIPPAPKTPSSPPAPVDATSTATKGPRRIKKTKKRVVKKTT